MTVISIEQDISEKLTDQSSLANKDQSHHNKKQSSSLSSVHLLAGCRIHHDGDAHVDKYFQPIASEDTDSKKKTAGFRGRYMRGTLVALPPGYMGYVVELEDNKRQGDAECNLAVDEDGLSDGNRVLQQQRWVIRGEFDSLTSWNHHVCPDEKTDVLPRSLDWLSLASTLHKEQSL